MTHNIRKNPPAVRISEKNLSIHN